MKRIARIECELELRGQARGLVLAILLSIGLAGIAHGQAVVSADTLSTREAREILRIGLPSQESWYVRSFQSFFGKEEADADEAARGAPIRIDEAFQPYAGLRIRNVWIVRREAFGSVVVDSTQGPIEDLQDLLETESQGVGKFLNTVATATQERTVRQYLRFQEGDVLDPFALGDSERLLRQRSYINDAKIEVVEVDEEPGWVDVVVLTRDRWPLGVKAKIHTAQTYDVEVFHRNFGGVGLGLEYEVPVDTRRTPAAGHRVKASLANLAGSFVGVGAEYQTQWDFEELAFEISREFVHPDIRVIGGVSHRAFVDKNNEFVPSGVDVRSQTLDPWIGYSFQVGRDDREDGRRTRLIPAVRFTDTDYLAPPREFALRESSWRDSKRYLGQLTLNGTNNYTTRLLQSYGETEDVPAGYWCALTGAYEDAELRERTYVGFRAARAVFSSTQSLNTLSGAVGGYLHHNHFEDGLVSVSWEGFSPLRKLGSSYLRNFHLLTFTGGINRAREGGLRLDQVALRDLDSSGVAGARRISAEFESVLFTPYAFLGFHIAAFGYAGGGFVGEAGEALFDERFAYNVGTGLRLNNPRLVIPTTEFRLGFVSTAEGTEFRASIKMGDIRVLRSGIPSARPERVRYE